MFSNMHQLCVWFCMGMLFVLVVGFSAQYIGDKLSHIILSHKSIDMFIAMDDDKEANKELKTLMYHIDNTFNLKQFHIKTKKIDVKDKNNFGENVAIVVTKNKEFMEELAKNRKLAILDRAIFKNNQYYAEYSKYDEYVRLETNYEHIRVYLGYFNVDTNANRVKVMSVLNGLSGMIFRNSPEDPNEESWFEKKKR